MDADPSVFFQYRLMIDKLNSNRSISVNSDLINDEEQTKPTNTEFAIFLFLLFVLLTGYLPLLRTSKQSHTFPMTYT